MKIGEKEKKGLIKGFVVAAVSVGLVLAGNGMTSAPWAGMAIVEAGLVGALINTFILHS